MREQNPRAKAMSSEHAGSCNGQGNSLMEGCSLFSKAEKEIVRGQQRHHYDSVCGISWQLRERQRLCGEEGEGSAFGEKDQEWDPPPSSASTCAYREVPGSGKEDSFLTSSWTWACNIFCTSKGHILDPCRAVYGCLSAMAPPHVISPSQWRWVGACNGGHSHVAGSRP